MSKFVRFAVTVVILMSVASIAYGGVSKLVGTWSGRYALGSLSAKDREDLKSVLPMLAKVVFHLQLKKNGQFVLFATGRLDKTRYEGKWTIREHAVVLTTMMEDGRKLDTRVVESLRIVYRNKSMVLVEPPGHYHVGAVYDKDRARR